MPAPTPQEILDTAFPGAIAGDGVQDTTTDEFWTYNGTIWSNVGTVPGPTATVDRALPLWSEKVKLEAPTRTGIRVRSYPYSLHLQTPIETTTTTGVVVTSTFTDAPFDPTSGKLFLFPVDPLGLGLFNQYPTEAPLPPIDIGAITYTQSSVYPGNAAATNAGMTNGIFAETTQTGTDTGVDQFVRMDFGDVRPVATIYLGSDYDYTLFGGWGPSYAENMVLERSNDGVNWINIGITGTFSSGIKAFPVSFSARFIRVRTTINTWLAVTEFYATSEPLSINVASITYSQNNVGDGYLAATNAGMTNGIHAETEQTVARVGPFGPVEPNWIRMDLGATLPVANIAVGCDFTETMGGWGPFFTEDMTLERSDDGVNWTFVSSTGTFTTGIKTFPVSFNARYIRIRTDTNDQWLVVTEFYATST